MGTRSLTYVHEGGLKSTPLVCMYRQMDGYPTGMGNDLKEILRGHELVNGFGMGPRKKVQHNGMGCLAAYVIGLLKWNTWLPPRPGDVSSAPCGDVLKTGTPIGSVYLQPVHPCMTKETFKVSDGSAYANAEYAYVVYNKGDRICLKVFVVGWKKTPTVPIYDGPIDKFNPKTIEKHQDKLVKDRLEALKQEKSASVPASV